MPQRRTKGQGSLKRRNGSRIYTAVYIDAAGNRRERSTGTTVKKLAETYLQRLVDEAFMVRKKLVDASQVERLENARRKVVDVLDEYISHSSRKGDCQQHINQKRSHIIAWIDHAAAESIADLSTKSAASYLDSKRAQGIGNRTWNATRQDMAAFMRWCQDQGMISENPVVKVPKRNEAQDPRLTRRALTDDELNRLMAIARRFGREAWYGAAAFCGLRKGELRRLDWSDVDFDKGEIQLRLTKAKRKQTVPMPSILKGILLAHRARQGNPSVGKVWPTTVTDRTRQRDFERASIPLVDEAGRVVDLHALRKTLCTRLARNGVPQQVAQRVMRHSDYRVTQAHYVDISVRDCLEVLDTLPSMCEQEESPHAMGTAFDAPSTAPLTTPIQRLQTDPCVVNSDSTAGELASSAPAGIAQLVERQLPKLNVEGSSPFARFDRGADALRARCSSAKVSTFPRQGAAA